MQVEPTAPLPEDRTLRSLNTRRGHYTFAVTPRADNDDAAQEIRRGLRRTLGCMDELIAEWPDDEAYTGARQQVLADLARWDTVVTFTSNNT